MRLDTKINNRNLIIIFLLIIPVSSYLLPFIVYAGELSIRIYVEGSFENDHTLIVHPETFKSFQEKLRTTIDVANGIVYKIPYIYSFLGIFCFLAFLFLMFFFCQYKSQKYNYELYFKKENSEYKKNIFWLILILTYLVIDRYADLKKISNFFFNIKIFLSILLYFYTIKNLLGENKKIIKLIFFIILILGFALAVNYKNSYGFPVLYPMVFNIFFLVFVFIMLGNSIKKNITVRKIILTFSILSLVIVVSMLIKMTVRSSVTPDLSFALKKSNVYNVNKIYDGENVMLKQISIIVNMTLSRINKIDQLAYILGLQNFDFLYGKSYTPLIGKLIPRQIWPEKPQEIFGNIYGRMIQITPSNDRITSDGASTIIESYLNFGFFGFFFLAIFYSFLFKFVMYCSKNIAKNDTVIKFLFISSLFFLSITFESNLSSSLGGFIQLLFLIVVFKIIRSRSRIID
jgi:hypothetical protein